MKNRYCLLLSAIAFLSATYSAQAQIAPDGSTATQINGNAIAPTGSGTVNGGNLYHSFNEFNVPQSGVTFNTGNSSVKGAEVQNIINRVTGGNPSAVLGTIESRQAFPNANLYLMNPNGIVFGQNARLDIGGSFHATTGTGLGFDNGQTFNVDKNSLSFPSGDPKNIRFAISQPAGIINQGNLSVDTGKSITFTGGTVINTGTLTAPSGNVALTSVTGNSQVELRSPDAVLGLQVTANAIPTNWNGKITELPKLAELLTGKVPEANQVVVKADGSIALVASPAPTDLAVTNGMTIVSGRVDVSDPSGKGGNVGIFGEKVGLVNAQIDASGLTGGGTVLIGGDFQGKGTVPNALRTFIDSNSRIDVSAILNGNGGKTIVWSDQSTRFLGTIVANGGTQSGNGGFVEVSGKQNLDYSGIVNTLAVNGNIGTLLLDPTDITVIAIGGSFTVLTDVDQFADPNIGANTLAVNLINSAATNVILQATNDINFNTPVAIIAAGVGLTAQAGRDINVNNDIATTAGAINFIAGRDIVGAGGLKTSPAVGSAADVNLTAGRDVRLSSINATAGTIIAPPVNGANITVQAGGNIQTTGTFFAFGNTYSISSNASAVGNAGNISLTSTNGAIDVSSGRVHAVATVGNSGNITFQASGDIKTGIGVSPLAAVGSYIAFGGNGNPGTISFVSSGGAIDTSLGEVDAGNSNIGNGGKVFFQAASNIVTGAILAGTFDSNGNGGRISLISQLGSINTTIGQLNAGANGNGGSIFLQALGNITTNNLAASSNLQGNAGSISLTSTSGTISTTLGTVRARIFPGGNGFGGNVTFQAFGDINTGEILATGNLGGGSINLISNGGKIDTTLGSIDTSATTTGNGGNISFQAASNIVTSNVSSLSATGGSGNGGLISLISSNGAIDTSLGALVSTSFFGRGGDVSLQAANNIVTSNISSFAGIGGSGNGGLISLISSNGAIDTSLGALVSTSFFGKGGDVSLRAVNNIVTSNISSFVATGNAGSISLVSTNGGINTSLGTVSATSFIGNGGNVSLQAANNILTANVNTFTTNGNGGNINFTARNSITANNLNARSAIANGGNITLDPIGNIIFNSANTAGAIQGGSFSASSTGGNIRVLGFVTSPFAACAGASICSASGNGGTGGQIFLRHGGLAPFIIGDPSINGTAGIVTTGSSTLALGKIIPVGTSIFTQGNILVAPSGDTVFTPPDLLGDLLAVDLDTLKLLEIREVMKREVDRLLKEENIPLAFETIEKSYVSELEIYLGEDLKLPKLTINQAQEIMGDVSKRSGSISALIYPIMLNDRLEILVIPPKDKGKPFHRYTNYANEAEIVALLEEYRANLRDSSSQDYLVQAQKLYDWVMRPIDDQLQALKIETVVFVMDSGLRVIPPAAMHDGKQFLMERYASANIPALRVTRLEDRDRKNTNVLAMGLTQAREGLSALPAVEIEIRTIGTQVLSGVAFLDRDFTVSNMQEQRSKASYGILHLGTHGQFLADRVKDSYIQFWDSKLRSHQIPDLRFDKPVIDMLTLSACETAVGNNLGISGLAVESGARSILASLWTVSDAGTAPLMISLYKAFPNAISKATALRQAQLDLLRGKVKVENNQIVGVEGLGAIALPKGTGNVDLRHPFFWSSFILVGNWL